MKLERGPIKEEINKNMDQPGRHVAELFDALVYGDQPLGWDIAGTKETVDRMLRQDLINYFKTHYFAKARLAQLKGFIKIFFFG